LGLRGWLGGFTWSHGLLIVVCLLLVVLLVWAEARRYVLFRPAQVTADHEIPALAPEKKLFLHGSGPFEVSNVRRHLVEVPVVFWGTPMGEYILAAKVRGFNLLGVGVPAAEKGWWYIFLEPRRVKSVVLGQLYFGLQRRPAVHISYRAERGLEAIYLSSEDPEQIVLVSRDLRQKVAAAQRPARAG